MQSLYVTVLVKLDVGGFRSRPLCTYLCVCSDAKTSICRLLICNSHYYLTFSYFNSLLKGQLNVLGNFLSRNAKNSSNCEDSCPVYFQNMSLIRTD